MTTKSMEALLDGNLASENWAPVLHTAFRAAGSSRHASTVHQAIASMSNAEWLDICDYFLIGIRRSTLAALQDLEAENVSLRLALAQGTPAEKD